MEHLGIFWPKLAEQERPTVVFPKMCMYSAMKNYPYYIATESSIFPSYFLNTSKLIHTGWNRQTCELLKSTVLIQCDIINW